MKRTLGIFTLLCMVASSSWAIMPTDSNTSGSNDTNMNTGSSQSAPYSNSGAGIHGNTNMNNNMNMNKNMNKNTMQNNKMDTNSNSNGSSDTMDSNQH